MPKLAGAALEGAAAMASVELIMTKPTTIRPQTEPTQLLFLLISPDSPLLASADAG